MDTIEKSGKTATSDLDSKNRELAILAALAMHDQRAEDILILDLRELIDYANYFVIGSASSLTRMRGIIRRVEKSLAKHGGKRLNQPDREAAWILADFGDVLVHIFDSQAREFYWLEDLWGDAPRVEWENRIPRKES
ncbi:MAG: ribosome silencing factor [Planctomycetaceae bacterium]|nr:ribosome silencing factor [Planctomycetaceae bacterium]